MLENDVLMEKSTVQIQQEEASEEYIKRFPTKLHGKDIDYCALNYNRQFCKTVTEKDIWDKNYCFEEKINFAA